MSSPLQLAFTGQTHVLVCSSSHQVPTVIMAFGGVLRHTTVPPASGIACQQTEG